MVEQNKHSKATTEQALREALAEQKKHFTSAPEPLPPDVDQAFWDVNHEVLRAMREHDEANDKDQG